MQAMVISGVRLEFILVNPGVPEGLVLSPYIFLVYFNDLSCMLGYHLWPTSLLVVQFVIEIFNFFNYHGKC